MKFTGKRKTELIIIIILGVVVIIGIIGIGVGDACWCGLKVVAMDNRNIDYYNLNPYDTGVVVIDVVANAHKSGIEVGDLVTGINKIPVFDINSFLSAARSADKSGWIIIDVKRTGKQMSFPLSGYNAVNTGFSEPADYALVPTDPIFLIGGTNIQGNTRRADNPVQSPRIPTEGNWLGMEIEPSGNQTGLTVEVSRGSSAERGGLRNGDIISAINGQTIANMADYIRATENETIISANLEILRNGKRLYLTIPPNNNEFSGAFRTQPRANSSAGANYYRGSPNSAQTVHGQFNTGKIPPITLDSIMPHGYRGVCVICHPIIDNKTTPIPLINSQAGKIPPITSDSISPHVYVGDCADCHQIIDNKASSDLPLNSQARNYDQLYLGLPSPAQQKAAHKVLVEGHWLGMELIPITPGLTQEYKLPNAIDGLLVDEVTLEAAESGLLAGDVLQSINNYPIKTIEDFALATRRVESLKEADLGVLRGGRPITITLRSSWDNLGVAQNEAAQPIQPGALSPHRDRGRPCTDCHIIMKSGGQLAIDAGDVLPTPPPISKNNKAPHSYRGACNTCHIILN